MRKNKPAYYFIFLCLQFFVQFIGSAQTGRNKNDVDADSIPLLILDTVSIEARQLKNYNYSRYVNIVRIVYPYADTAIMLYKSVEDTLSKMSKHDYKIYKKQTESILRDRFTDKLKNFNRVEGEVLISIIERNTGQTMFDILKENKSKTSAFWWNNFAKLYGYKLKEPYQASNNPTLELIIADYEKRYKKK